MCDCFKPDGSPIPGNTRVAAAKAMDEAAKEVPWFGIEQVGKWVGGSMNQPMNE